MPQNLLKERQPYSVGDLETIEGMHMRSVLASAGTIKGAAAILASTPARWRGG